MVGLQTAEDAFVGEMTPATETDSFMEPAIVRLGELGHFGYASATEQIRTRAKGMMVMYPYFNDLFGLDSDGPANERRRLTSLFVGASAHGEFDLADEAIDWMKRLPADSAAALSGLRAQVREARHWERSIRTGIEAMQAINRGGLHPMLSRELAIQVEESDTRSANLVEGANRLRRQHTENTAA